MEKEEKKVYDFRQVSVEVDIDNWSDRDLRKELGNNIHRSTRDIGMDELARKIYREGVAEMSQQEVDYILAVLDYEGCTLNIACTEAIKKILKQ